MLAIDSKKSWIPVPVKPTQSTIQSSVIGIKLMRFIRQQENALILGDQEFIVANDQPA